MNKIWGYSPTGVNDFSQNTAQRELPLYQISGMNAQFGGLPVCLYEYSGNKWQPGNFATINTTISNSLTNYKISDVDDSTNLEYFGFLEKDSGWYILKISGSTEFRYVKGTTGYTTAWTGRAGQSYQYYDEVF